MDARHPLLLEKEMLPVCDPAAVIGRTSFPTLAGDVGWHNVATVVVDEVNVVVDVIVVVNVVVVAAGSTWSGAEPLSLVVGALDAEEGVPVVPVGENDWFCAYAAIPPETMTSIAATVRIWSLPALICMLLRLSSPQDAI
jgi:hypothetical protein